MKKCQNWITLPGVVFLLFLACRKDLKQTENTLPLKMAGTIITAKEWNFDSTAEGWTAGNANIATPGGALNITTTSNDPLLISPDNLGINTPAAYRYIRVRMKNNTGVASARIFFTTNTDTSWSQARSRSFVIASNNTYYASYLVDMGTVTGWTGTIKRIRVDPLDPGTGSGQTVSIDYIGITQAIPDAQEWLFDSDTGNMEGWTAGNATPTVSGGTLNITMTGTDPLLLSPDNLGITAPATYKFIHLDMKNNAAVTSARIFFITDADTVWSQAKSKGFTINANTSYYASYIVDMSTVTGWTGTIKRIRIDPLDAGAASGQTVNIDFIKVTDNRSYRGVMSPQTGINAGDADTLKLWKANVMRWQIVDFPDSLPKTVTAFDNWLTGEMEELDYAFDLCEPRGIKILIDLHFTPLGKSKDSGTRAFYFSDANAKLIAAWHTLAEHYKDRKGLFGYDLINEPRQSETSPPPAGYDFKSTQIAIGNSIRSVDKKTPIFIEVDLDDNPSHFNNFTPVPLTNVVYEVHMYEPLQFTYQRIPGNADNQDSIVYPGYAPPHAAYYDKTQLQNVLGSVRTFQTTYNARIFVGEFSAVRWATGAATYLRDCIDIFESYGWSWTYHAYREDKTWSLEYNNWPIGSAATKAPLNTPTDRYNQVVGYGLNLNLQ